MTAATNVKPDELTALLEPDRPHYATGMLLDEGDFRAEQLYHRGRLARALAYLHGGGTVAGLEVVHHPAVAPNAAGEGGGEERLMVGAGLAIDRAGRLIEIAAPRCVRLGRWYNRQPPDELKSAHHPGFAITVRNAADGLEGRAIDAVIVDLFLRFVACERGKTPAFRSGPFDALNAVQPSRLRDSGELFLVPRAEAQPPLPRSLWPDLAGIAEDDRRRVRLHETMFAAWPRDDASHAQNPEPPGEHPAGVDPTALFLARLAIPAAAPLPGSRERPPRAAGAVLVDNHSRLFAYPVRALVALLGF